MGLFDGLVKNLGAALAGVSLDGKLVKVGKAEWKAGIRWRMQQYWRGDSTAGRYGPEIYENRRNIKVYRELCSPEECRNLEIQQQDQAGGISNLPWCDRA